MHQIEPDTFAPLLTFMNSMNNMQQMKRYVELHIVYKHKMQMAILNTSTKSPFLVEILCINILFPHLQASIITNQPYNKTMIK